MALGSAIARLSAAGGEIYPLHQRVLRTHPHPNPPRKRERERTSVVATNSI
jgi:hypothetical protein